jgi:TolB-like protein/Flp pilus assembly protein TadD
VKAEVTSTCQACGACVPAGLDFCPVCALLRVGGSDSALGEVLDPVCDSPSNPAETEPSSIVRRFENYEVMLDQDGKPIELGRGAMGITYKAFDIDLRFPVTLKVISEKYVGDESARLRFLREARAAAKVRHPNVASVFHLGRIGGGYFYAMEYVEGETLENVIKRCGGLEVKLALEIVAQVAAGLAAVHKQNLVHRDVKPSNIIVALESGGAVTAKIIDLGLAKGASELGSESEISTLGAFAGTPAFASPEQFAGLGADIRSDLYSLGVTLWEMLAGQVPFRGSPSELMHEHRHAPLPREQLKGLPQPVVVLLEVMLEKDPAQRFQDPAEVLRATSLVVGAINAGRSVTPQGLRAISGEGLAALQKNGRFSKPVRPRQGFVGQVKALLSPSRARLFAWLVGGLLFGGIAILAINGFFRVSSPAAESPVTPSVFIKAPEKSIAVLPFDNISPNKDDTYFADGVQDEILNTLAKIGQLKVICRTSVMQYRADAKRDLRQIANVLGVANVLEGTVRREGKHVRISTELVDARNDTTIWADSYDRDLTDIFGIQSEIAQQVASKLSAQLSPQEQKDIEEKPTDNLEAYDLYLQAKQGFEANYWTWDDSASTKLEINSKIISLLEEAIQKDGKFALAYCLIAEVHDTLYVIGTDHTPERRALADAAINEALRLRPDLPEVHLAMADHLYSYRDFERARVQLAIAAQARPNNAEVLELTALIDRVQGRWDKATAGLEKAITLDPRNVGILGSLQGTYASLGRYRDNRRTLDRLIELEPNKPIIPLSKALLDFSEKADVKGVRAVFEAVPSSIRDGQWVISIRIYLAICSRDFAAAESIISQAPAEELLFGTGGLVPRQIYALWVEFLEGKHPTTEEFGAAREQLYRKVEADPANPFLMEVLAYADASLGRKEEAIQEGRRAMEMRPISEDAEAGPGIATDIAMLYAMVNESESAFEQLTVVIKTPAGGGLSYGDLKTNPGWDPLRKDPRFDKLLAELAPRD